MWRFVKSKVCSAQLQSFHCVELRKSWCSFRSRRCDLQSFHSGQTLWRIVGSLCSDTLAALPFLFNFFSQFLLSICSFFVVHWAKIFKLLKIYMFLQVWAESGGLVNKRCTCGFLHLCTSEVKSRGEAEGSAFQIAAFSFFLLITGIVLLQVRPQRHFLPVLFKYISF